MRNAESVGIRGVEGAPEGAPEGGDGRAPPPEERAGEGSGAAVTLAEGALVGAGVVAAAGGGAAAGAGASRRDCPSEARRFDVPWSLPVTS